MLADCEARFKDAPFLGFAIEVARQRILSQSNLHDMSIRN